MPTYELTLIMRKVIQDTSWMYFPREHGYHEYHMDIIGHVAAAPGPYPVIAAALGPEIVLTEP